MWLKAARADWLAFMAGCRRSEVCVARYDGFLEGADENARYDLAKCPVRVTACGFTPNSFRLKFSAGPDDRRNRLTAG